MKNPFSVVGFMARCNDLNNVPGAVVETHRTRLYTRQIEDANNEPTDWYSAHAIDGTLLAETAKIDWQFSISPGFVVKQDGFRRAFLACSSQGKYLDVMVITRNDHGKNQPLLVGIRHSVSQVTASIGMDRWGRVYNEFWVDTYRFGQKQQARVKVENEGNWKWQFPMELATLARISKPGELLSKKPQIMAIIEKDLRENCKLPDKLEALLKFVEAMAVAFLRASGQEGASLTKPEPKPVPAPKAEALAPAAPEAPAPAAEATEEPAPMPTADEPAPEVSDQEAEEEFVKPDLHVMPPLTDEQKANVDAEAAGSTEGKPGRNRSRMIRVETGTDGKGTKSTAKRAASGKRK
jgi:hypothetical protein